MCFGRLGVVEEGNRDPAGVEMRLHEPPLWAGGVRGGRVISELGVTRSEQLADHRAALIPPLRGIRQRALGLIEIFCRRGRVAGLARLLRFHEQE